MKVPCPVFYSKLQGETLGSPLTLGLTAPPKTTHTASHSQATLSPRKQGLGYALYSLCMALTERGLVLGISARAEHKSYYEHTIYEHKSADRWGATVISESVFEAKISKLPLLPETNTMPFLTFPSTLSVMQEIIDKQLQVMQYKSTSRCNAFHPFTVSVSFQADAKWWLQGWFFPPGFWCEHLFLEPQMKKPRSIAQHDQLSYSPKIA